MEPGSTKATVGVILPLSGKWESVGQKILKGIETASRVFTKGPTPNIEYIIKDYGNNEDSISAIIKELDEKYKVAAIIGLVGVGERTSETACKELQKRRISAFVFPQSELRLSDDTYCFRNFLTIDIQVKSLLNAARSLGIKRFAIMSPDDRFGKIFSEKFQRQAPNYGISVARTSIYSPETVDFKMQLKSLWSPSKKSAQDRSVDKSTNIQAILVADTATNAAMIASYMNLMKIKNIRLFGPILWDTPELIKAGSTYIEDSIYLSGYYQGSILSNVQEFNRTFSDTFSYQPSIWEASAYDCASILQDYLQTNSSARENLKEYISNLKNYHGVSGITSFSPDGALDKSIYILTIKDGMIHEIHPSLL